MNRVVSIFFCFLFAVPCFPVAAQTVARQLPADTRATKETVALYNSLKRLLNKGILFGHQDDLAYGVGWQYERDRSDIKDVTGEYPAVYGWELGHLETDRPANLDSVPFTEMRQLIRKGYERGGVITISWHLNNPFTGGSAWEPAAGTVASVLPGGSKHERFKTWLDKVAAFLNTLKGVNGEFIPVIFRPFHELNGDWFWWGGKHCTPDEFKRLWIFTVAYLRDKKQLHHLLYAYNTDRFQSKEEYLLKYPGDAWVDVVGFDIYQRNSTNEQFRKDIGSMLSMLEEIAIEKNKLPALTEFGGNLADSAWWTGTFLPALAEHKISYVLGWRNAGAKKDGSFEYYVPYAGHSSAADFASFYNAKQTLFQTDIKKEQIYR